MFFGCYAIKQNCLIIKGLKLLQIKKFCWQVITMIRKRLHFKRLSRRILIVAKEPPLRVGNIRAIYALY